MKQWYCLRQIDAWYDGEGWIYNQTFDLVEFYSSARDEKALLLRKLHKLGIKFRRGTVRVEDDLFPVLVERKTGRPLFELVEELPF